MGLRPEKGPDPALGGVAFSGKVARPSVGYAGRDADVPPLLESQRARQDLPAAPFLFLAPRTEDP